MSGAPLSFDPHSPLSPWTLLLPTLLMDLPAFAGEIHLRPRAGSLGITLKGIESQKGKGKLQPDKALRALQLSCWSEAQVAMK